MEKDRSLTSWGVSVEDIPPEGLSFTFEEFSDLGEDIVVSKPFSGSLSLNKRGIEVKVAGTLKGAIVLTCDRCLAEYEFPIDLSFNLILRPRSSLNLEETKELSIEELDVSFYDDDFIAFAELLREEVMLAIPYKTLCREDCKGICQVCGKNLNEGPCSCRVFKKSSPFAILKDLLSTSKEMEGG
jgi:uncharacterized protein